MPSPNKGRTSATSYSATDPESIAAPCSSPGPDVEAAIEGHDVLLEPFVVAEGFLKAAFVLVDGAPIELMQYRDPNETGWYS